MSKSYKYKAFIILICIVFLGSFFRFYNAKNWMHYQLDQVRDYKVINTALKHGLSYLPLQGPRAAGSVTIKESDEIGYGGKTTLRLGPLFYYIEYVSALVFGNSPFGSVVLIIILSILSIFVFYLFVDKFFDKKISLGLATIFASSLFFVSYSRFSWNPNIVPFFSLFFLYSLIQIACYKERQSSRGGLWLLLSAVSFAFVSNAHFLAFISFGIIGAIFLFIVKPSIKLKFWFGAILIFITLNIPLIINDYKTNGENFKAFVASVLNSDKKDSHSLVKKTTRETLIFARYNWIVISGHQRAEIPAFKSGTLVCDKNCKEGLVFGVLSIAILFFGFCMSFYFYKKTSNKKEKYFLLLIILWGIVIVGLYAPLSYDFAPRFFLLFAPLSLVLLGMILNFLKDGAYGKIIINSVLLIFVVSNIYFTLNYFAELREASNNPNFDNRRDYILGEKTRITYAQIQEVFEFMIETQKRNNLPIFLHGQSEFERVFRKFDYENYTLKRIPKDAQSYSKNANYFFIIRTQSDFEKVLGNHIKKFDILEKKVFGTLTVYKVKPKKEFSNNKKIEFRKFKYSDPIFEQKAQVRYLWHQVFSGCRYSYETNKCEKN